MAFKKTVKMREDQFIKISNSDAEMSGLAGDESIREIVKQNPLLNNLLNLYSDVVLVLNSERDIVLANNAALQSCNKEKLRDIVGLKIGTAFGCKRDVETDKGCGKTKYCSTCGATQAISESALGNENPVEYRLTSLQNGKEVAFDYKIQSKKIELNNEELTLFIAKDISEQKKLEALEKIFFHDVLNTSGALLGLTSLLPNAQNDKERDDITSAILESSKQLIDEIKYQQQLLHAERGELEVKKEEVFVDAILKSLCDLYCKHELSNSKNFHVELPDETISIVTDATLLVRSLSNLAKNALEASQSGDTIRIYVEKTKSGILFNIYNSKVIDPAIQLNIFQRSFSTKNGLGRGVGTYSVKLLVEQYLGGKAYFTSNENIGTVFTISLPTK